MGSNITEDGDALISALTLLITPTGQLVIDRQTVNIDQLKCVVAKGFPEWVNLDNTIDTARWVDGLLNEVKMNINSSIGDELEIRNESIRIQK